MAFNYTEPTSPPRVRFAPSPTGDLHIGSARTALFNYLFARHYGGSFILRIEDTDKVRSTEKSLRNLVDGLKWLGINWDEGPGEANPTDLTSETGDHGPYLQSIRRDSHLAAADKLKSLGFAYECACPPVETAGASKCQCALKQDELGNVPEELKSLKFKIPPGPPVMVHDLIRGEVMFRRDDLQDFVIVRAGGLPTYNFVVVVDDASMEISHVIRGEDHLSNTPKQILIFEALSLTIPIFAHIPLIHGSDGTRMSKRHGAVTVEAYMNEGFLPEAFVNYLSKLGWTDGTDREIYTLKELEEAFTLSHVSSSPATFDRDKILWFNGKYVREISDDDLLDRSLPFLAEFVDPVDLNESTRAWLTGIIRMYKERLEVLGEIPSKLGYFFNDPKGYDESALRKAKVDGDAFNYLVELKKLFLESEWTTGDIETVIRDYIVKREIKLKAVVQPLRLVITGTLATPGIFDTLFYVGKEPTVRRLEYFLANYRPPG